MKISAERASARPSWKVPPMVQKNTGARTYEELVKKCHHRIYARCLRMTHDPSWAEDLTQEAELQIFLKANTFRGKSRFTTWLFRLTTNVVLMHLRRHGNAPSTISLDEVIALEDGGRPRQYGREDHMLMSIVDRLALEQAMGSLPPGYKTAILLRYGEEYKHEEIAVITGGSIGNSKSQTHKARQKLKKLLTAG